MKRTALFILSTLLFSAAVFATAPSRAIAHGDEGVYDRPDCPIFDGCEKGMAGFVTGMDHHGCETFKCVPADEVKTVPHFSDHEHAPMPAIQQAPAGSGNTNDNLQYKYDQPKNGAPVGSRLIDVQ